MNRRDTLLALLALGAIPHAARAQQPVARIGVLFSGTRRTQGRRLQALREGLTGLGYVQGANMEFFPRWDEGDATRLPDLAADLLRDKPDVLVASPLAAAAAARKHTATVPIVVVGGAGAVQIGIVKSHARPGGNVTGVSNQGEDLARRQLEMLQAVGPGTSRVGYLTTGKSSSYAEEKRYVVKAAKELKLTFAELRIDAIADLDQVASKCGTGGCEALLVATDPLFLRHRPQIAQWAARLGLPALYPAEAYVRDGGLISYSANANELFRRAATYVDKILKGALPAALPMAQPARFDLIVNLKVAKAMGVTIPPSVLAQADVVIQ